MARPTTLPPVWAALAEAMGGVGALAEACGVSADTLGRWGSGASCPAPAVQAAVNQLANRRGLKSVFKDTKKALRLMPGELYGVVVGRKRVRRRNG